MASASRSANPTNILGGSSSSEAERWLGIAEKLLAGGDFSGSRSFASRAHELGSRSDRLLAVVDSLIAGNMRINDKHHDWYAILQLSRFTHDQLVIAKQYARLASLLSPVTNSLPFADRALQHVADAFSVLSTPAKRSAYDRDLTESIGVSANPREPKSDTSPSFWTACPYCFYLYEYLRVYEDCALRCQNCRRAFQAMAVQSPPPDIVPGYGGGSHLCSWELFPLGFLDLMPKMVPPNVTPNWSPFLPMFACPLPHIAANNVVNHVVEGRNPIAHNKCVLKPKNSNVANRRSIEMISEDEDEEYIEMSDSDDDDWDSSSSKKRKKKKHKKAKNSKARKGSQVGKKNPSELHLGEDNFANLNPGKASVSNTRRLKGKVAKDLGKLDLNVEFSNDAEDAMGTLSGKDGEEEEGIEGNGFFEGLDEFLNSLPILSAEDEKLKAPE